MKISELTNREIVIARTGRAGREAVEWKPWTLTTLYVTRRECDLPQTMRKRTKWWHKGDLLTVTLHDRDCAEGSMADFCPDPEGGTFVVEDYYLQIRGLEADTP